MIASAKHNISNSHGCCMAYVLVHEDGTGLRGDVHALPDEEDFSLNGDVLVVTAATYY